jgi:hypothetical protein
MAKRHYSQSKMDRMHERRGMERMSRKDGMSSTLDGYAGMESRNKNMYNAGEYVNEGTGYADLPQEVKYSMYERTPFGIDEYLDDGIRGIDNQVKEDRDQVRKGLKPQKY